MDRYKFYDDDDWNNIDLENDINYEESYRGFKIVRMEDGHYEIYRLGRKRNVYMLDSGFPDNFENNQYEKNTTSLDTNGAFHQNTNNTKTWPP